MTQIGDRDNIVIDDLRFHNEHEYLRKNDFKIVRLLIAEDKRIERLKTKYPENFKEHISGFNHNSEKDVLALDVDLEVNSDECTIKKIISFLNISQTNLK